MSRTERLKIPRPKVRRTWVRTPVTKPHSTPKGKKGYHRPKERGKEYDLE
ncbi:MAG: hypothetical protein HY998_07765 [candidate division NC10 bacterium]|nr:hypothetical protein [candidate division NC10 bacterium]